MSGPLLSFPRFQAIDGNGNPLRGGKLYTYASGTSSNKATYSDFDLTTANTNPVILDSDGQATIYLNGSYKLNLKTSADGQMPGFPIDNIAGGTPEVFLSQYDDLAAAVTDIGATETDLAIDTDDTIGENITIPRTLNLRFLRGNVLTISNTFALTFADPGSIIAPLNQQLFSDSNTDLDGVALTEGGMVSAGWWGAVDGGSITSSWSSAMSAINSAGKGTIEIPTADYTFADYAATTTTGLSGCSGVAIHGNWSTITYAADTGDRQTVVEIQDTEHVSIRDLVLDGNIANNDKGSATAGHLINLQSVDHVTIDGIKLSNAQWDGLRISDSATGDESTSGLVTNFLIDGCQRNGISLVDAIGWTFDTGRVINSGDVGAKQISPMYGVDLEASTAAKFVSDIRFENVEFSGNAGIDAGTINGNGTNRNVTFNNCKMLTTTVSAVLTTTEAENYTFSNCRFQGRVLIGGPQSSVRDSFFFHDDTTPTAGGAGRCLTVGAGATGGIFEGNEFYIDGSAAKVFVVLEDRTVRTTMRFANNKFTANGASLASANLIDVGNDHANDKIVWRENEFIATGSAPASPYYVTLNEHLRTTVIKDNMFVANLRLDSNSGFATRQDHGVRVVGNSDKPTSGAGEDDLNSAAIKADSMGLTRGIEIFAAGTITNVNGGNKTITIDWGGQKYTAIAETGAGANDWQLYAVIYNTATNAQRIWWQGTESDGTLLQGYETAAIDTTATATVKVTGECADAGDTITQTMWIVKVLDSRI